ncbi:MAG: aminotransferase class V-fold PLP-dependent enzyme [Firmicutes bacterium]|nr:aminotransferase class V-fold PLP-dependent enzyme [Bacillota bacterium]
MIYFDNAATSFPKAPGTGKAVCDFLENASVNTNRGAYKMAYDADRLVFDTRTKLARLLGCDDSERVIFTSGVTASLNLFLMGGFFGEGDHIIISSMEHHAVTRPVLQLQKKGVSVSIACAGKNGILRPEEVEKYICSQTKAIIINHASNVCGRIVPIAEIGDIAKKNDLIFAVDSAQSAGVIPVSAEEMGIDFLAFSGHKGLLGPQGIGGFVISERLSKILPPFTLGGTGSLSDSFEMPDFLPDKYEGGTLNLPGIAGLSHSLDFINEIGIENIRQKERNLTDYLLEGLKSIPEAKVTGGTEGERLSVISLDFPGRDNSEISFLLDNKFGIMTRVGLHCAPLAHKTLGTFPKGTLRVSLGYFNTFEEVDIFLKALKKLV